MPTSSTAADGPSGTYWDSVRRITPGGEVSTLARLLDQPERLTTCPDFTFCAPWVTQVMVDAARDPYVSTSQGGLGRVRAGALTVVRAPGVSEIEWQALDHLGNFYGAAKGVVYRFNAAKGITVVAGTPGLVGLRPGALPGTLGNVRSIAVVPRRDASGTVSLVVSSDNAVLLVTVPD